MNWFSPSEGQSVTMLENDLLGQNLVLEIDVEESPLIMCRDDFMLSSPNNILQCDELFGLGLGDDIYAANESTYVEENRINCTQSATDGDHDAVTVDSVDESQYSISSFGSAATDNINHTQLNGNETSWLSSSTQIEEGGLRAISTSIAASDSTRDIDIVSYSCRRSYSTSDSSSKNAIAARDNRLKKKRYIAGLEESLKHKGAENKHMTLQNEKNSNIINSLKKEVLYLQRVIANQSTLSALLKSVAVTPEIKLSSLLKHSTHSKYNCMKVKSALRGSRNDHICASDGSDRNSTTSSFSSSSMSDQADVEQSFPEFSKNEEFSKVSRSSRQKAGKGKCERVKMNCRLKENATVDIDDSEDMHSSATSFSQNIDYNIAGICLHVSGSNVSIEFCRHCNASAHSDLMSDYC